MQLVVMLFYSEDSFELGDRLGEAFDLLGGDLNLRHHVYLSYLDASMNGIEEMKRLAGIVPCRSIWDASSCRLSAVLLLELSL
jgi:hypothetical protein